MRVWAAPRTAGLWAHETLKGVARFTGGTGRESPVLWGNGKENTVGVGGGDRTGEMLHGGSAWILREDTLKQRP